MWRSPCLAIECDLGYSAVNTASSSIQAAGIKCRDGIETDKPTNTHTHTHSQSLQQCHCHSTPCSCPTGPFSHLVSDNQGLMASRQTAR